MKKIFLILILFVGFLTTACSSGAKDAQTGANNDKATVSSSPDRRNGARMPDFGQPDRPADIMGVVKSITGNQVTILKIDKPVRGVGGQRATSSSEQKRTTSLNLSGATGGRRGGSGNFMGGLGGRPSDANGTFDRAAMLENLKKKSTGEVTVTIPIGIKMLISDSGTMASPDTAPKMNEANLTDIKQDKMLNIWLNQEVKDQSIAEFVFVR